MTDVVLDEALGTATDTETTAAAKLGALTAAPFEAEPGALYTYRDRDGELQILDTDEYAPTPRRTRGVMTVTDAASFIAVAKKHGNPDSEYWADVERLTVRGVLNAPGANVPAWADHRVTLCLKATDEWTAWAGVDGRMLSQTQFAEHLEQWGLTVMEPDAASMLELAQSIRATTKVNFQSGKRLSNGETQLAYIEETEAKGGHRGDLPIPNAIILNLIPFHGANSYPVRAMFRYRIVDGGLTLGVVLERPEDVKRKAFEDQAVAISTELDVEIWNGIPA